MASVEITIHVKRDGLHLYLRTESGKLISTMNLQEYLGLSDEQAKELLTRLDEHDKGSAEEAH